MKYSKAGLMLAAMMAMSGVPVAPVRETKPRAPTPDDLARLMASAEKRKRKAGKRVK